MGRKMRIGLSLLSGERVRAADIGYDDVATRQIACPNCKEALVKAVTTHGAGVTHYLRHRQRPRTEIERGAQAQCELRAMWMQREMDSEDDPFEPRGQTIESFLEAFSTILDAAARTNRMMTLGIDWDATDREIEPSARCQLLLENWSTRQRDANAALVAMATGPKGGIRGTAIDAELAPDVVDRHYAMTRDIWTHLNTPDARPNLDSLLLAACEATMDEARATLSDLIREDEHPTNETSPEPPVVVRLEDYLDEYMKAERHGLIETREPTGGFLMAAAWLAPLVDGSGSMRVATSRRRLTKRWPKLQTTTLNGGAWQSVLHYAVKVLRLMVLLADLDNRGTIVRTWTTEPDGTAPVAEGRRTSAPRTGRTATANGASHENERADATKASGPTDTELRRALTRPSTHGLAIQLDDGTWATVELTAEEILGVLDRRQTGEPGR